LDEHSKEAGPKGESVDPQVQTNLKRKTTSQPEKAMPIVTDEQPLTKAEEKKASS
jgi:hypothetical protein